MAPNPVSTARHTPARSLTNQQHNRPFNHVGLSVSDIEATVAWYSETVGFRLIGPIVHIKRSEKPDDGIFQIYPDNLNEVKLAKMTTGNGVGFELFEFINPGFESAGTFEQQFQRGGFFHICITDPDPETLAARVKAAGGSQAGKTIDPTGRGEMTVMYLKDPWGNVIEVTDVGFEYMACREVLA